MMLLLLTIISTRLLSLLSVFANYPAAMQVALQCITWTAAILSRWKTFSPNHHNSKSVFSKLLIAHFLIASYIINAVISMILCVTIADSRQDSYSSIVYITLQYLHVVLRRP
jgi:hypothetical protein